MKYDGTNHVAFMTGTKSEDEWNEKCDQVKAFHRGEYPESWFLDIVVSGLVAEEQASWPATGARP